MGIRRCRRARSCRRWGIRRTVAAATMGYAGGATAQVLTNWNTTTGQYIQSVNWDNGAPTAVDYASINNGGTATISGSDAGLADILNLGVQTSQAGRLEISGGSLDLVTCASVAANPSPMALVEPSLTRVASAPSFNRVAWSTSPRPSADSGVQSLYIGDSGQASGNTAVGNYSISAGNLKSASPTTTRSSSAPAQARSAR